MSSPPKKSLCQVGLTFKRDKFSFKDLDLIIFFIIVPVEIES